MRVKSRLISYNWRNDEDGHAEFQVPDGAVQVQTTVTAKGSLVVTWIELTNGERHAMQQRAGGGGIIA